MASCVQAFVIVGSTFAFDFEQAQTAMSDGSRTEEFEGSAPILVGFAGRSCY